MITIEIMIKKTPLSIVIIIILIISLLKSHAPFPPPAPPPHGGPLCGQHPRGARLAIRAQVGWLPLPRLSRRGKNRAESKAGQPLTRYFPEIAAALLALPPRASCWMARSSSPRRRLLLRRPPPAHPPRRQPRATPGPRNPALFIVFDLLSGENGHRSSKRRCANAAPNWKNLPPEVLRRNDGPIRLSPATEDLRGAEKWLGGVGATLDGIIAKRLDAPYGAGERTTC